VTKAVLVEKVSKIYEKIVSYSIFESNIHESLIAAKKFGLNTIDIFPASFLTKAT
jgi:hypothetical protein